MILELKISNFAIIDNLTVDFHPGLNVLTGETGAGKSIIMDALDLILGGRADTDSIRSSEDTATVEARLQVSDPKTLQLIRDSGIPVEEDLVIIRRQISHKDKNRCYMNNSSLTVSTLAGIGNRLVDIHGQHDHQSLLHPENHVDLLDSFAGLNGPREKFQKLFGDFQSQVHKINQLRNHQSDRLQRQDLLTFQIGEIDQADLQKNEEEDLRTEKNKLSHAENLHQSLQKSLDLLADSEGSVLERLGNVDHTLQPLPEIDPALQNQAQRGQNAFYEIQELVEELRDYMNTIQFSPTRLEEIDDRLAEINGLKRKYGNSIETILEYRQTIGEELEALSLGEDALETLEADLRKQEKAVSRAAIDLAERREKSAKNLQKNVERELKDLNMKQVRFGVRFHYPADPEGFTTYQKTKVKVQSHGIGAIEFLFSPNPGEDLRPLAKIASGGELSRVMLALKTILNTQDAVPVMVFDEVDAGISGQVAEKVGQKLKYLADDNQIFCITHLPQIAGFADSHYRVAKSIAGQRTRSVITELKEEERVEEIARMSGGEKITQATLQYAREMIK